LAFIPIGFSGLIPIRVRSSTRRSVFDARNLRLAESGLKGWVLDRTGKLENALIRYRSDAGIVTREYPLGAAAVHVTGYSDFIFGAGGFEAAFRAWLTEPTSTYNQISSTNPVGKDLKVTIDSALQRETFNLLQSTGKASAAVVLLLPNNEVLAMASYPSFDPTSIRGREHLEATERTSRKRGPRNLLARSSIGHWAHWLPGAAHSTIVLVQRSKRSRPRAAIDLGITNERFTCRGEGFTPPGSSRSIRDYGGEVHGTIGLHDAFRLSCNQYFAQLGLKLGKERLASYARRMRMALSREDKTDRSLDLWQPAHGNKDQFDYIFAPLIPRWTSRQKPQTSTLRSRALVRL
jgi:cell division protein FtsI/penicillin-binding protein 2